MNTVRNFLLLSFFVLVVGGIFELIRVAVKDLFSEEKTMLFEFEFMEGTFNAEQRSSAARLVSNFRFKRFLAQKITPSDRLKLMEVTIRETPLEEIPKRLEKLKREAAGV